MAYRGPPGGMIVERVLSIDGSMLALGRRVCSVVLVVVVSVVVSQPANARSAVHPITAIAFFITLDSTERGRGFDLFLS